MVLTMARPKDKNYDYRSGSSLLKKQQEANTKKYKEMTPAQKKAYNVKQAKSVGALVGTIAAATPVGRGASIAGKVAAKTAAKKYGTKVGETVTKVYTQGKNARVINKAPKSVGGAVSSPVKKTKTLVQTQKRGSSPLQQSSFKEGRTVRQKVKTGSVAVKSGVASLYGKNEYDKNRKKK